MIRFIETVIMLTLLLFSFFLGVKYSDSVKKYVGWFVEMEEQGALPEIDLPEVDLPKMENIMDNSIEEELKRDAEEGLEDESEELEDIRQEIEGGIEDIDASPSLGEELPDAEPIEEIDDVIDDSDFQNEMDDMDLEEDTKEPKPNIIDDVTPVVNGANSKRI